MLLLHILEPSRHRCVGGVYYAAVSILASNLSQVTAEPCLYKAWHALLGCISLLLMSPPDSSIEAGMEGVGRVY